MAEEGRLDSVGEGLSRLVLCHCFVIHYLVFSRLGLDTSATMESPPLSPTPATSAAASSSSEEIQLEPSQEEMERERLLARAEQVRTRQRKENNKKETSSTSACHFSCSLY